MFNKSINPTSLDDIYNLTNSGGSLYIQNAIMSSIYVVVYHVENIDNLILVDKDNYSNVQITNGVVVSV